ncbi:unnamed protein product [Urochloa humidicola]
MMLGLVCRICVEPVRQSSCERAENACRVGVGDLVINTVNHLYTVLLVLWELISERLCASES